MDSEPLGIRTDQRSKFLTDLGASPETIAHARTLLADSRRALGLYLPDSLPLQPSIVVPTRGDLYGGGEYLGQLGGTHYLEVGFGRKPELMDDTKREALRSVLTHESVHQKQWEIPKIAESLPSSVPSMTPDEIANATPQQIIDFLRRQNEARQGSDIQLALLEGHAWQTDLFILRKRIEEAKIARDQQKVDLLTTTLDDRLEILESNDSDAPSIGSRIILGLADRHGFENMFDIVQTIDWQQCGAIQIGTPEYEAIIQDPTKLPGLNTL